MHNYIPYGRQFITDDDIKAVSEVMRSDFLTQGPAIQKFEASFASKHNSTFGVAVTSATTALHIAYQALGIGQGDIVWTSPNTFVATSNAALYLGAEVDFVDIDTDTFCMSVSALEAKLNQAESQNRLPKLVVPVHFGGLSCNMKSIRELSNKYGFKIVEDASHSVGASYGGQPVGSCQYSDACVFSFHPVKIITTGEGGLITANDKKIYQDLCMLRTHGITKDVNEMQADDPAPWEMEQQILGYNYRMTDFQAALGNSQLKRLNQNIARRRALAQKYREGLNGLPIHCQGIAKGVESSWHLFPVLFENGVTRRAVFDYLREHNIGTQVHYMPVYWQPYYKDLGFKKNLCPNADDYYSRCLSLPMFHGMTDEEHDYILFCLREFFK